MDLGRPPEARYLGERGGQYLRNIEVNQSFHLLLCVCVFDSCVHENTSLGIHGRARGCSRAGG